MTGLWIPFAILIGKTAVVPFVMNAVAEAQ
jgi:hypothetical protein